MANNQSNGIGRITKLPCDIWRGQIVNAKSEANNPEVTEREQDAFTEVEQALLRALLPDSFIVNGILLMLGTGIRTQEMLALRDEGIAHDTAQFESAITASYT